MASADTAGTAAPRALTLFLCGDVMTGRGIDQMLAQPSRPQLFESYVTDAREYLRLAEQASGPIGRPVDAEYIWGEALAEIGQRAPLLRLINLETAVTTSDDAWPGKGIHYRMHPANVGCLTVARIDGCALANNHVLDWGRDGMAETLRALHGAGVRTAGAGADGEAAAAPAVFDTAAGRVLFYSAAAESSGVPRRWRAAPARAGVWLLDEIGPRAAAALLARIDGQRRAGDTVLVSLHWGGNWGYAIERAERAFARALVDGGVDLVHGHSSHHARACEVYRDRLILYGCGDFINDYEGIGGHEPFRGDIAVAHFATLEAGRLQQLSLVPFRARRLGLRRASAADGQWLCATLNREGRPFGTRLLTAADGSLQLVAA